MKCVGAKCGNPQSIVDTIITSGPMIMDNRGIDGFMFKEKQTNNVNNNIYNLRGSQ